MKTPKQVVTNWAAAFNARDAAAAAALYHDDAINVEVALDKPARGREEIYKFVALFSAAFPIITPHLRIYFRTESGPFSNGVAAATFLGEFNGHIPNGKSFTLRGCGFFHVVSDKIKFQRGYFDKATSYKQLGLPME